jgi:hypothetical protein
MGMGNSLAKEPLHTGDNPRSPLHPRPFANRCLSIWKSRNSLQSVRRAACRCRRARCRRYGASGPRERRHEPSLYSRRQRSPLPCCEVASRNLKAPLPDLYAPPARPGNAAAPPLLRPRDKSTRLVFEKLVWCYVGTHSHYHHPKGKGYPPPDWPQNGDPRRFIVKSISWSRGRLHASRIGAEAVGLIKHLGKGKTYRGTHVLGQNLPVGSCASDLDSRRAECASSPRSLPERSRFSHYSQFFLVPGYARRGDTIMEEDISTEVE